MLCNMVKDLISLTEDFPSVHKVIQTLQTSSVSKTRPSFLHPMSPGHLFRKKGLNITKHKKIMKKSTGSGAK